MQEIVVDKCDCPFEVSAIVDIVDLIPGATYKYQLILTNAGNAIFHPSRGEFIAKSTTETLNIIVYLKDNPNSHYLISLELVGSHPTNPEYDQIAKKFRRQIICIKNISCSIPQCTSTPTPTPTPTKSKIDKYLATYNYSIQSYEDKTYGLYRSNITIRDWVEFLNSVAQYEDQYSLWKPQMATDKACGIQKVYDGFFYVYTVDGCTPSENECYPNEPSHLDRAVSYVGWNDLARYVNWISNGKPKGKQGPSTTEDGSYPLFGNFYSAPIDYYPNARFWLESGPPPTPSVTPTNTITPTKTSTQTPTPSITSSPLPVGVNIITQPPADVFTAIGISRTISVSATAVPSSVSLLYQWQESPDGGATWNNISGATQASYNITSTQVSDNGKSYRVRVSGVPPAGLNTPSPVFSNASTLTVQKAQISISSQPSNVVTSGTTATFSVSAIILPSLAAVSYQWQRSSNGGTTFTNISGATSASLNLSGLSTADSGLVYRVIVSGTGGADSVTSFAATLVVNAPVIQITQQPVNTTSANASATFSVVASISGLNTYTLTYVWQLSTDGGANFTTISNSNSPSLPLYNITKLSNNFKYRVVISSNVGSSPVTSDSASLTVNDDYGGLLVWGSNSSSQLNMSGSSNTPIFTNKATNIYRSAAVGQNHVLMVNASGILETYGVGTLGQTGGNGTSGISQITTKYNHNLAIISDKLYSWGANSVGQCGLGTISTSVSTPTIIPNDSNNYIDIATGENHSLAVRSNNVLVACGGNVFGQLGTTNNTNSSSFVSIMTGITQVACGQNHSASIGTDGKLYTWGANGDNQLGHGDTNARNTPTQVTGGSLGFVTQVSCGQNFTVVLNSNGQLFTFGSNSVGQLGKGDTATSSSIHQIAGTWSKISAGNLHVLAIKTDGSLWAWGQGLQGQLGNGSSISSSSPIQIAASNSPSWIDVFAGGNSSLATRGGAIITIPMQPITTEAKNGTAAFSVAASVTNNATLSYQWQRSSDSSSWSNYTGATSSSLVISNIKQQLSGENQSFDGYTYRCVVSATQNAININSNPAMLIDKTSVTYYRGNGSYLPSNPYSVWTQWSDLDYGSTSIKPYGVVPVQVISLTSSSVGFLLSNGTVYIKGSTNAYNNPIINNTTITNPSGDTIVKLISDNLEYYTYTDQVFLLGVGSSGKLYGVTTNGISGNMSWTRIGPSLLVTDVALSKGGSNAATPTIYAISATDNTLWAWGRTDWSGISSSPYSFATAPRRISTDTWLTISGARDSFWGIKTDGFLYRLSGTWIGGGVTGVGGNTNSGTLALNSGSINPVLVDTSTNYTKLLAHDFIVYAVDANQKIHCNWISTYIPNFNSVPALSNNVWTTVNDLEFGSSYAIILYGDNPSNTADTNVALHSLQYPSLLLRYGTVGFSASNTLSSISIPWGSGATAPLAGSTIIKPRFISVLNSYPHSSSPDALIAIKES